MQDLGTLQMVQLTPSSSLYQNISLDAELDKQLVSWLDSSKFDIKNVRTLKAMIAPFLKIKFPY